LLFRVDIESQLDTLDILERQFASITVEIRNNELLRESIHAEVNLFNLDNEEERDFYFRYQRHITDIEITVEQIRNTNLDIARLRSDANVSLQNARTRRSRLGEELGALRLFERSVELGENLVPRASTEHYARFLSYQIATTRFDELIILRTNALERAELLYEVGGISRRELENAQLDLDSIISEMESYKNEIVLTTAQSIRLLETNMLDLDATINSANAVLSAAEGLGYDEELIRERARLDMLSFITDNIFSLQSNSFVLEREILSLRTAIDEAYVYAPIDGTLALFTEINIGDFIQAGTDIATIIPSAGGELRVLLAVSNSDIADIELGQQINYRFAALPLRDFGEMTGRVTNISTDARRDSMGNSYFMVEAELDGYELLGRGGEVGLIRVGMVTEARVVTRTHRIIYWVLDLLDFVD
jgi:HlyD family secretion protein